MEHSFRLITPTPSSADPLKMLETRLRKEDMLSEGEAAYTIIPGDRYQALQAALDVFRDTEIIHLWAGEGPTGTADDRYRTAITALSSYQLCTNQKAEEQTKEILKAFDRRPRTWVIGNIMLSSLDLVFEDWIDQFHDTEFDLVLIHPETGEDKENSPEELVEKAKSKIQSDEVIWLPPNGDPGSEVIEEHANQLRLNRPHFLGAVTRCETFITNSSSAYYEAQFLKSWENITFVGNRNICRKSSLSDMDDTGAIEETIRVLKEIREEQPKN